jgi:hypothetical protein
MIRSAARHVSSAVVSNVAPAWAFLLLVTSAQRETAGPFPCRGQAAPGGRATVNPCERIPGLSVPLAPPCRAPCSSLSLRRGSRRDLVGDPLRAYHRVEADRTINISRL